MQYFAGMRKATSHSYLCPLVLVLGACVTESPERDTAESDIDQALGANTRSPWYGDLVVAEVVETGHDAVRLFDELMARLEERGVTLDDLQAAIDAGDEETVRELFGYPPEDLDAVRERLVDIATSTGRIDGDELRGGIGPPGAEVALRCKLGLPMCALVAADRGARYPGYVGIGIFVVGSAVCLYQFCEWGDSDGRRDRSRGRR